MSSIILKFIVYFIVILINQYIMKYRDRREQNIVCLKGIQGLWYIIWIIFMFECFIDRHASHLSAGQVWTAIRYNRAADYSAALSCFISLHMLLTL